MKKHFLIAALLSLAMSQSAIAAGGLMVTPNRVVLNEKNASQEVKLINRGTESVTYRISFQHLRMNKDGSYTEIKDTAGAKEKFADEIIPFSPRQTTLKAGETQTVRLVFKKPSGIADGEYRSHLLMQEEAPADLGKNVETAKTDKKDKRISVILKPLFGASIPVIATVGKVDAKAEIKNVKISGNKLKLTLARSGNASVYGDLIVTTTDKQSGKQTEIGALNSVSVFFPYDERLVTITLDKAAKTSAEAVDVKFYGKKEDGQTDKNNILAASSVK